METGRSSIRAPGPRAEPRAGEWAPISSTSNVTQQQNTLVVEAQNDLPTPISLKPTDTQHQLDSLSGKPAFLVPRQGIKECSICLQSFDKSTEYPVSLRCGHTFGDQCIAKWRKECPECRQNPFLSGPSSGRPEANSSFERNFGAVTSLANQYSRRQNIGNNAFSYTRRSLFEAPELPNQLSYRHHGGNSDGLSRSRGGGEAVNAAVSRPSNMGSLFAFSAGNNITRQNDVENLQPLAPHWGMLSSSRNLDPPFWVYQLGGFKTRDPRLAIDALRCAKMQLMETQDVVRIVKTRFPEFSSFIWNELINDIRAFRSTGALGSPSGDTPLETACTTARYEDRLWTVWQVPQARLMAQAAIMHAGPRRLRSDIGIRVQLASWLNQYLWIRREGEAIGVPDEQKNHIRESRIYGDVLSLGRRLRTIQLRHPMTLENDITSTFLSEWFTRIARQQPGGVDSNHFALEVPPPWSTDFGFHIIFGKPNWS